MSPLIICPHNVALSQGWRNRNENDCKLIVIYYRLKTFYRGKDGRWINPSVLFIKFGTHKFVPASPMSLVIMRWLKHWPKCYCARFAFVHLIMSVMIETNLGYRFKLIQWNAYLDPNYYSMTIYVLHWQKSHYFVYTYLLGIGVCCSVYVYIPFIGM